MAAIVNRVLKYSVLTFPNEERNKRHWNTGGAKSGAAHGPYTLLALHLETLGRIPDVKPRVGAKSGTGLFPFFISLPPHPLSFFFQPPRRPPYCQIRVFDVARAGSVPRGKGKINAAPVEEAGRGREGEQDAEAESQEVEERVFGVQAASHQGNVSPARRKLFRATPVSAPGPPPVRARPPRLRAPC